MIYQIGKQPYYVVSQLFCGKVNDVCVCRPIGGRETALFTIWAVKDRRTAKTLIRFFAENTGDGDYLGETVWENGCCFLFRYTEERPALRYFQGEARTMAECEELTLQLASECLLAQWLPAPILCLILKQGQVNIGQDGCIYFTYTVNLDSLDETAKMPECAAAGAAYIAELLKQKRELAENAGLIQRKAERGAYPDFYSVCRDIRLLDQPGRRLGKIASICGWAKKEKGKFSGLLIALCLSAALFAVIILLSQAFTGDVALFRLFRHTFDVIGTETLS